MSEPNTNVVLIEEPPYIKEVREGEYVIVVGVPANLYTKREIKHPQILFAGRQEFVSFAANGLPSCIKAVLTTDSCANHLAHDDAFHARVRIHVLNSPQIIRDTLSLINFADGSSFAKTLDGSQLATEEMRPKLKERIKAEETQPKTAHPPELQAQTTPTLKQPPPKPQIKSSLPTLDQLRHAAEKTCDNFWGRPNPCTIGGVQFDNRPHAARAFIFLYPDYNAEQIRTAISELGTPWWLACEVYNTAKQKLARHGGHQDHTSNGVGNDSNHHNYNDALSLEEENAMLRELLLKATDALNYIEERLTRRLKPRG